MIDRRRGLIGTPQGRLPSWLQEVDAVTFIRGGNVSGSRVNTELKITSETIKIEMNAAMVAGGGRILYSNAKTRDTAEQSGIARYGAYQIVGNIFTSNNLTSTSAMKNYVWVTSGHILTMNRNNTEWSGSLQYEGSIITDDPLCIGAETISYPTYKHTNEGPYGELFLWQDGVLSLHFIPCRRVVDNQGGFYDLCGNICSLTGTPFFISDDSRYPILPGNDI